MKVSETPDYFESIANHPRVFSTIKPKGVERAILGGAWDQSIGLEFDGGGWLLQNIHDGLWEVHTLFLPGNHHVRDKAKEALLFMFTVTTCRELCTKVPEHIRRAKQLAIDMGFRQRFTMDAHWPRDSGPVGLDFLYLPLEEWVLNLADTAQEAYLRFWRFCKVAGNPDKGRYFYNRWAALAKPETVWGDV